MEIVNPQDAVRVDQTTWMQGGLASRGVRRDGGVMEPGFQDMAEDLALVKAGESFMGRDPVWFQLEVSLALWKRLKVVESRAGYCACPDAPQA